MSTSCHWSQAIPSRVDNCFLSGVRSWKQVKEEDNGVRKRGSRGSPYGDWQRGTDGGVVEESVSAVVTLETDVRGGTSHGTI